MQITEIITDETLREIREHGTPEFPFEYYLDDIDEIGQGYVEWHWHNEIEWAWVESGKVICRIGNEKIILEAGEGIFINSRVIHRFETPGGALMPNILHAPELLAARESAIYQKYVSPVITYGKEYVILEKEKNSGILSLLDEIYKDAGKEMLRKELIIQNKISRLWDELFEEVPDIVQRESRNKNLLLQSAVCYDDECVAVLRDDINANTSKITANTTKITEIDKTVTDIAKHQIFVVCDGDHDELKLQAAISTAPYNSVIYPVGTKCVLTNENTIRGYGLPESSGRAIISLKGSMTLDGSMCDDFIFKNTNPAEKQHIFHIPQSTTMKNVKFEEDIKTVTSDTINPIVLFAETESEIVSCSFVNIFSTHQLGVSTFKLGKVLFFNNVINGFEGAPGNVITREISIANYAKIIGNEFLDFTQNKQCLGYMLSASKIFFQDNYIENCENCIMSLGGNIIGNVFSSIDNCTINCGGEIIGNTFSSIYQNEDTSFLTNSGRLIGNQFTSIRITGEYVQFIDCSNSSIISDNYMSIASIPATGSCSLISASGRTLILNNSFSTSSSLADNNEFNLLDVDGNTVIKNNVTSAKSFGRIADTCIAEGNITSWS